ncbi:MAG TPA: cell division protein FtsQ/DivIB [Terriglobales bacterium]|nr:cell division protein FtsQ/DivIB [Terriglobales bacterium]
MRSLTAPTTTSVSAPGRSKAMPARPPVRKRPRSRLERFMVRGGMVCGVTLVLGITTAWGIQTGWLPRLGDSLGVSMLTETARFGLALDQVQVTGRSETSQAEILAAIGVQRGTPLLAIDIQAIRQRLIALPWVASATVERRFLNGLAVDISEAQPLALWQRQQQLYLVSRDGKIIETSNLQKYAKLLIIVGDDAPLHADKLIDMLASEPDLQKQVTAAVWVGKRRWNLRFNNNVDVKLPEDDPETALHRFADINRQNQLLDKDITIVDMRLPDAVVVRQAHPVQLDKSGKNAKPAKNGDAALIKGNDT